MKSSSLSNRMKAQTKQWRTSPDRLAVMIGVAQRWAQDAERTRPDVAQSIRDAVTHAANSASPVVGAAQKSLSAIDAQQALLSSLSEAADALESPAQTVNTVKAYAVFVGGSIQQYADDEQEALAIARELRDEGQDARVSRVDIDPRTIGRKSQYQFDGVLRRLLRLRNKMTSVYGVDDETFAVNWPRYYRFAVGELTDLKRIVQAGSLGTRKMKDHIALIRGGLSRVNQTWSFHQEVSDSALDYSATHLTNAIELAREIYK